MEPVDILRDDGFQDAPPLQFRQSLVPRVGLDIAEYPMLAVELEERLRMVHEETVGGHLLRAELLMEPLAVYAVRAAEVRDARLRGHPCAAEKDGTFAVPQNIPKSLDVIHDANLFHSLRPTTPSCKHKHTVYYVYEHIFYIVRGWWK